MIERKELFIGGRWEAPVVSAQTDVISPATEEVVATVPATSPADVDRAVAAARTAFDDGAWSALPAEDRAAALDRLAGELEARVAEFSHAITLCMGAPVQLSGPQVFLAAMVLRSDAALVREFPFTEIRRGALLPASVEHEPVGVVATIPAWNGSLLMNVLKMGPALAAGCTVVAKPAAQAPLDALLLAEAVEAAGFPDGVVSILPGGGDIGAYLVEHPDVDMVSFTGSVATGRQVGESCGRQLKRCTLELGGKSAAIVLDDAHLGTLAAGIAMGSFANSGQMCNGFTRLIVPEARHDDFVDAVVAAVRQLAVGDPFDEATMLGPLGSAAQRDRVESYIRAGLEEGATLAVGGGRPEHLERGYYVEPTVFVNVDNSMRIAREEIFGPVLSVIPYDGSEEVAIRIANDSEMGLHGAVFSADEARAYRIGRRIRTGTFSINGFSVNPGVPFGGYKDSGLGRESGIEGLKSFLEVKTIHLTEDLATELS